MHQPHCQLPPRESHSSRVFPQIQAVWIVGEYHKISLYASGEGIEMGAGNAHFTVHNAKHQSAKCYQGAWKVAGAVCHQIDPLF